MRIAIATNFLYPENLGGTELYCHQLAESLIALDHQVFWIVPHWGKAHTCEEKIGQITIVRFAAVAKVNGHADYSFVARSFINELQVRAIQVAHFNEFGGFEGMSIPLLSETKKVGIKVIVTFHLAQYFCHTGTLHFGGLKPCDGKVIPTRCASCSLLSSHSRFKLQNFALARSLYFFTWLFEKTWLRSTPLMQKFLSHPQKIVNSLEAINENADSVISLTLWFKKLLILNGVKENKVVHIPQATSLFVERNLNNAGRKNYVYVGRISSEKGIEVLLEAAQLMTKILPETVVDVYGPIDHRNWYQRTILKKINSLPNVKYKGKLEPQEVVPTLQRYKAVLVPSLAAEMAPLIILEANKLRIPVIASDVPGSKELIENNDCGIIFTYASATALVNKIEAIHYGRVTLNFNPFINDFSTVAQQHIELYAK